MRQRSLINMYKRLRRKPTPPSLFVKKLAELTHRSESSVRKWLSGEVEPDMAVKEILSDYFNTPIEVLFPPKEKN